jgi:hypothetical protein
LNNEADDLQIRFASIHIVDWHRQPLQIVFDKVETDRFAMIVREDGSV